MGAIKYIFARQFRSNGEGIARSGAAHAGIIRATNARVTALPTRLGKISREFNDSMLVVSSRQIVLKLSKNR